MSECTCTFDVPRRESATFRDPLSGYVVRLDEWHDDTVIDPDCSFHGENGSMVAVLKLARGASAIGEPSGSGDKGG